MTRLSPRPRVPLPPLLLLALLLPAKGWGQAADLSASPDSALAAALRQIEGVPLTLDTAIEDALANAVEVRLAEAALRGARGDRKEERGAFDPELFGQWTRTSTDTPTSSPFAGANPLETDQTVLSGGVNLHLPIGTDLSWSLDATRGETNSTFANLDPEYQAGSRFTVRQPLLRGFGPSAWANYASAARTHDAAVAGYEDARAFVRAEVEAIYWNLHAAERDLAVQLAIRDMARALLEEAKFRHAAGLVGPNQVNNARVFLAEQEQAVLDREEQLDGVSDRVASMMDRRPAGARFRAVSRPPARFEVAPEDSVVARALRANRELRAARMRVDAARARARGAGWDALPALDFVGGIGGSGLSGRPQEVVFGSDTLRTTIDGGQGEAVTQAWKRDFPSWNAGLVLSWPIGLRADRGARERAEADRVAAEQGMISVQRLLEERVRSAWREVAHGDARLAAAREGVDASFEQVRIGRIEYRNGRNTAFELVRLGADLASAQQRFSQALVRTARARAELARYTAETEDVR